MQNPKNIDLIKLQSFLKANHKIGNKNIETEKLHQVTVL